MAANKTARRMLALTALAGLAGCQGGERYRDAVDPCYPERYNVQARAELVSGFSSQVQNGRILDQTIWNYAFEAGSDKLNNLGLDRLDQIVRRRPNPDSSVFLQTARDIPAYKADAPDAYATNRRELDEKRVAAIQKYLAAQTAGRPMDFTILIHDPSESSIPADAAARSIRSQRASYTGQLGANSGGGGGATGGLGVTGGSQSGAGASGSGAGGTQPPPSSGTGVGTSPTGPAPR